MTRAKHQPDRQHQAAEGHQPGTIKARRMEARKELDTDGHDEERDESQRLHLAVQLH